MKKIVIVTEQTIVSTYTGKKVLLSEDRDGNRYYSSKDYQKITCLPPFDEPYKEGYGTSIEEAYCHMNRSFNIPNRLTS